MAAGDTHNLLARHPAGDRRNYKARHPHRCRCQLCTSGYSGWYTEYRNRVKAEVRQGKRPAPAWLENKRNRERSRNKERDAARARGVMAHLSDIQVADELEYLPRQGTRRPQVRATIYLDRES